MAASSRDLQAHCPLPPAAPAVAGEAPFSGRAPAGQSLEHGPLLTCSSPMFLTVKLLLGRRCSVKVTGQESVAALKKLVSRRLQVPEEQQHLLFRGQILADDKLLSDYSIGPNAAINVIMRPPEASAPPQARRPQPLWQRLDQVLAKHFSPQDAEALLRLLRQEHEARLQRIGLGDLEQLAQYLLAQEPPAEPAGDTEAEAAGDTEAEAAEPPEKGETDQ